MKPLLLLTALGFLAGCEVGNVELSPAPRKSQTSPSAAKFAMVSTPGFPGESQPGVVRAEPWGEQLATIPSGTLVWVGESRSVPDKNSKQPKKWFRVRFWSNGIPISGWMHGNILKPPAWKESVPTPDPIDSDSLE